MFHDEIAVSAGGKYRSVAGTWWRQRESNPRKMSITSFAGRGQRSTIRWTLSL